MSAERGAILFALRRHAIHLLVVIAAFGILSRLLLALFSPQPYGYVYDFYHEAVQIAWWQRRMPVAADCWQCYHPPFFYLLSVPLFGLGRVLHRIVPALSGIELRLVSLLSFASGIACVWYGFRLFRLLKLGPELVVLGTGLLAVLPVLFFSTYGIEADVLLGAFMGALLYYATRYALDERWQTPSQAVLLGVLAGLAAGTKYSGLVGVLFAGSIFLLVAIRRRALRSMLVHALLAAAAIVLLGSWRYVDNWQRYGNPLFANGTAAAGFVLTASPSHLHRYEFATFRLPSLIALTREGAPRGHLTDLPVYRSFWTVMYGLTWNDLGFFSNPTRHGDPSAPYPARRIPWMLASSVLILGLVPTFLAAIGFAVSWWRSAMAPLTILAVWTVAAYVPWVVRQSEWALKPKYLLFLAPLYCVFAVLGLERVSRNQVVGGSAAVLWILLLVLTAAYLVSFAIG